MENSPCNPRGPAQPVDSPSQTATANVIVSTPDIQRWMAQIQQYLNEVCSIAADGKLNTEQKMKITNLCRKVESGTSQMAIIYQSLKQKAIHANNTIVTLNQQRDLTEHISELKQTIRDSSSAGNASFADMVKRGSNHFVRPNNLSSVAIYPNDKFKTSDETKELVKNIIRPERM